MDMFEDEVLREKKPVWEIAFMIMNGLLWDWSPAGEFVGNILEGLKGILLLVLLIVVRTILIVLLPLSVAILTYQEVKAYKKEVARAERARRNIHRNGYPK